MDSLRHADATSRTLLVASLVLAAACSSSNPSVSLTSIGVTPPDPSIAQDSTVQLTATGTYSDSSTQDVTSTASWMSSDTSKATVSSAGLVTGVAPGTVTVTASVGSVTGTVSVTVTAATLESIAVTPPNPSTAKGSTVQFTATGTYSDSTTQDLTSQVTWASDTATVASISNAGLATAVDVGSTSISATLSGVTGSTLLTVTAATLQSIAVTPPNPLVAKGNTVQFTATGTYSDNSTQDISSQVTWASSMTTVATISNDAGSNGLASTVGVGTSDISATLGGTTGSTVLTVTAATLQAIAVTPPNPSTAKGSTLQFTATGTFSDNSTQDLTNQVTWASSVTTVATISNAAGSKGLASAVNVGTSNISAALSGTTGSTVLTVTAATLQSIAVTPPNPSVAKGSPVQFTATGTFSDNSTQDITNQVTWASSVTTVATISNAAGSKGLASTVGVGSSTISAAFSGKTGSSTLTVTAATLQSISVTPATPSRPVGITVAFTATGIFTDGTTQDLTTQVMWSSSNTAVATISNATGSKGVATPVAPGTTNIGATLGTLSGSTVLTVTSVTLDSITVTPVNPSIAKGTTQQFTATGNYSDGNTFDLTQTVTWASSKPAVATISNAAGSKGKASAAGVGTTTISADFGGKTGSTDLTVTPATLVSLAVTPAAPSIPRGLTQQFIATGTFSDGSTQVLTSAVNWSSTDPVVASISNAAGSKGLATGLSVGTTTIRAAVGTISGSTTLGVTDAILVSIAVSPSDVTIPRTTTQQFTALGTFSDSAVVDLTTQVNWASSNTTVIVISNAAGSKGLATALSKGNNITITATATEETVSGTATATVP
jgi:trimeric autotransporter adhesin